jgi:hypothetical protein
MSHTTVWRAGVMRMNCRELGEKPATKIKLNRKGRTGFRLLLPGLEDEQEGRRWK